jgi:hypothetical protein
MIITRIVMKYLHTIFEKMLTEMSFLYDILLKVTLMN